MDPRYLALANMLSAYSTEVRRGENVLIDAYDVPEGIVIALVRAVRARGGVPYVQWNSSRIQREILSSAESERWTLTRSLEMARMKKMSAYIALRGAHNIFETSDVDPARMRHALKEMRPVQNFRVNHTKWVVLRWPTSAMAQQAGMSTEAFEDFYFKVCTLDYRRMEKGALRLKKLMEKTDRVQIKGPGTDLSFSIKGIGASVCTGKRNIPDGEVFSCPVRNSVEGVVQYNVPTVYQGVHFDRVRLVFRKGKIVEATSSNTKRLNEILDSDEGARYIGEFALGFNPYILKPMQDILFDEKIAGSFHFTPGQAYEETDNGNRSQVHWDMVCIQRKEYGGGEIWFDGKQIRKNGLFVIDALKPLNPDALLQGGS
ncbi:MAG: aminopeptidase [Candidatus Methylacidiphilales bacterium]